MKRLIALIGAVATAFGLYADPVEYYANSFETTTEGLSQDGTTWSAATPWSTELTDAFKVEAYGQGEPGVYSDVAARRTTMFQAQDTNLNVLKLETGTNTLDLAIGNVTVDPGKFYFDQLVKFTGFEEEPTFAADTKIAVWMSAIEQEGTPAVPAQGEPKIENEKGEMVDNPDYVPPVPPSDDYIAGETNLYVQVGTGTAARKVQIKGSFATETWYRITIKSLGNVIDPATGSQQAGFLVFINGQSAEIVDADKGYYGVPGNLLPTAKDYYDKGLLFTAIDTTSVTLAKVGYQGIGAIDDVILTSTSPDFDTSDEIEIEIGSLALKGAKVIKIGDVTITDQTSIKVKQGDILVSYAANGPYIVRNGEGVKWTVNPDGTVVMGEGATIQIIEAAAKITRGGVATYYAADELDATIALVQDGDTVTFLKQSTLLNSAYTIPAGTTIAVAAGGVWTVNVPDNGRLINTFGVESDKNITITLGNKAGLVLSGTIYSGLKSATSLTVNGAVQLGGALTIGAVKDGAQSDEGAVLTVTSIRITGTNKITLVGKGKVITKSVLEDAAFTVPEGYTLHREAGAGDYAGYTIYTAVQNVEQPAFETSATVAADLATAIAYLKNNYYNKYTNGDKVAAPNESYVKVGTLASEVTGTVSIGGTVADAGEKFSLSIGNNAFLESVKFKIVGREVYVAAVILAIEQVKVTANATDYPIDSASSGQLELESFNAVAPTTIAGEGTNFTIVRGDDKPLVKFFFTDKVTQYFVTKKTFIGKDKVATTSYGFTTPDEGGLWLYLGYGVGLGGNWDGVTYNYTVYAFGTDKKAITLSMSITDKAIQPPTPTYTVTFSTNTVAVAEKTLTDVKSGTQLAANQIPDFGEGTWDVQPLGAIITSNTNFNFTVKVDPIPSLPAEPTADDVNAKVDAAKFADSTVKTMIGGDPTKYNAFKTWAGTVTGGEAAVVASAHAADSYLLGQTTLLENAPVSEIKTIAKTSDTALTLTFEIKDGANAVTVAQTAADYVKGLVQCNEKVDFGNGTKIDATVTVTINGQTLTAAVTLPANKPAAFMKVAK